MGTLDAKKKFDDPGSELYGDRNNISTFAIQFGGGARFWLNDNLSVAPTIMGMYGHTYDFYNAHSSFGLDNRAAAEEAGLINWSADTWTIIPAANVQYGFAWHRTIFTLSSDFQYFHTESFSSSPSSFSINDNAEAWKNKIDVDVPLGKEWWGHELRTGGFLSRTEFYDGLNKGLQTDHLYEFHGRLVLDFLNQLWKVQWIGLGASYMWGSNFDGWSFGADVAFRF
jgi:hypothetical protein